MIYEVVKANNSDPNAFPSSKDIGKRYSSEKIANTDLLLLTNENERITIHESYLIFFLEIDKWDIMVEEAILRLHKKIDEWN